MPQTVNYVARSSQKVCQLTGEFDREREQPTLSRTETNAQLAATDLGASVAHDGRIYFLFGDSHPSGGHNDYRPRDGNSIAYTTVTDPTQGLGLEFVAAPDGGYLSPSISPAVSLEAFEVPTGGFSADGWLYAFFTTDHIRDVRGRDLMGRSVLARSADGGRSFELVHEVSRLTDEGKFINVAPVVVADPATLGIGEAQGPVLLLFGSGAYRQSSPYLAYVELSQLDSATAEVQQQPGMLRRLLGGRGDVRRVNSAYRYLAGYDPDTHLPTFSQSEADAIPLFEHPCIGELSVSWNPYLGRWLMLYNCDHPRGLHFHTATEPWGPWSEGKIFFDPWADGGYCGFIHRAWEPDPETRCDSVHDPGRENEWGGEYGPYVIDPYTAGVEGETTIYYVLSTWNPYNTVLMRSTFRLETA